jgi:hypothetical protein
MSCRLGLRRTALLRKGASQLAVRLRAHLPGLPAPVPRCAPAVTLQVIDVVLQGFLDRGALDRAQRVPGHLPFPGLGLAPRVLVIEVGPQRLVMLPSGSVAVAGKPGVGVPPTTGLARSRCREAGTVCGLQRESP